MCTDCYVEYGQPTERFHGFDEIAEQIKSYYLDNAAGGSLHIVLDDWNLDDSCVDFCIEWAREYDDPAGIALGERLRLLTLTQRASVLASVDGYAPTVRP